MGRANGALERVKTAANIQGKGKSAHSQKVQKEEDPEGYQRRPEKQIDPQRERQEKKQKGRRARGSTQREREQTKPSLRDTDNHHRQDQRPRPSRTKGL